MDWSLERGAETVDDHVRFLARWGDRTHHVFVATALVERLAGGLLSRSDAAAFVDRHARRFVEAARRREDADPSDGSVIVLEKEADLA